MSVPDWCGFFDADDYETFRAELDAAAACFGADGQDLSEGSVDLAAGADLEIHSFPLARLAARCSGRPRADWAGLCFDQVDAWSTAEGQYAWLERASFEQVRERLRVRPSDGRPFFQGTTPDAPREPYHLRLPDGALLEFVIEEVPSLHDRDEPLIDVVVHNAAVSAWGRPPSPDPGGLP